MRTILRIVFVGAGIAAPSIVAFWAGAALAQTSPAPASAIDVANGGKRPIVAVYTSPPGRSDWSDDMLGKGTLRPGKTAKLKLKAKPDGCKVDFSALLDNGETTVKKDIDLCADTPNVGF